MGKLVKQSIVGDNLVVTIEDVNYYTRTINNMLTPKMKHTARYKLTLDYDFTQSFTINSDEDTLKGLVDFIYKYLENN